MEVGCALDDGRGMVSAGKPEEVCLLAAEHDAAAGEARRRPARRCRSVGERRRTLLVVEQFGDDHRPVAGRIVGRQRQFERQHAQLRGPMQVVAGGALRIEHPDPQRQAAAEQPALVVEHRRGDPQRDRRRLRQIAGDHRRGHANGTDGTGGEGKDPHLAFAKLIAILGLGRSALEGVVDGLALGRQRDRGRRGLRRVPGSRSRIGRGVHGEEILYVSLCLPRGGDAGRVALKERWDAGLVELGCDRLGERLRGLHVLGHGLEGREVGPFLRGHERLVGRRLLVGQPRLHAQIHAALDGDGAVAGEQHEPAVGREVFERRRHGRVEMADGRQDHRLVVGGERAIDDILVHDREELPLDQLAGQVGEGQPLALWHGMRIVHAPVGGLRSDHVGEGVEHRHRRPRHRHGGEDRAQPAHQPVALDDRLAGARVAGRVEGRRRHHALDPGLEREVLLQTIVVVGGVAIPGRQIPAVAGQVAAAGHLQVVGGVEIPEAEVVVAAVAADDRQAPHHVEVVAVGEGGPPVLALVERQEVGPHGAHSELGLLPGSVHEAELPDGPFLPGRNVGGLAWIELPRLWRLAIEGGLERPHLLRHVVRSHHAGFRVLPPGQPRLVVEMHARHVAEAAIDEGLLSHPLRAAAGDVGVGPVALAADVHLVGTAHGADADGIHTGPHQGDVGGAAGLAAKQLSVIKVVAKARLALFEQLLWLLGGAPVDETVVRAAEMAEHLDLGPRGRRAVGDHHGVGAGPQERGVDMEMLRAAGGRQRERHASAIGRFQGDVERAGPGRPPHREIDPLIRLIDRALQGQREAEFGRCQRGGRRGNDRQPCRCPEGGPEGGHARSEQRLRDRGNGWGA